MARKTKAVRRRGVGTLFRRPNKAGGTYYWKKITGHTVDENGKKNPNIVCVSLKTKILEEAQILAEEKDRVASIKEELTFIHKIKDNKKLQECDKILLDDVYDQYVKESTSTVNPIYKPRWNKFLKWCKESERNYIYMHDIDERIAKDFFDYLKDTKIVPATHTKYRGQIKKMFRTLLKKSALKENPFDIEYKLDKAPLPKRERLTKEELNKIVSFIRNDKNDEEFADFVMLLACTGMRTKDGCLLEWSSVKLAKDGSYVNYTPHKTAKSSTVTVSVPVVPALKEILLRRAKINPNSNDYVFPKVAEDYEGVKGAKKKKSFKGLPSETFRRVLESLGIEASREVEGYKKAVAIRGLHSLRHTFVSICTENNIPTSLIKAIVGHTSEAMTEHYTALEMKQVSESMRGIENFIGVPKTITENDLAGDVHIDDVSKESRILELVKTMTADNWQEVQKEIIANG
jgi:integrase